MPHKGDYGQKKVHKVMKEFKRGTLHSGGSGKKVKSRKQAIAIAMSEAGLSRNQKKSAKGSGTFKTAEISQGYRQI